MHHPFATLWPVAFGLAQTLVGRYPSKPDLHAWAHGYIAGIRGVPLQANPYQVRNVHFRWLPCRVVNWIDGHSAGRLAAEAIAHFPTPPVNPETYACALSRLPHLAYLMDEQPS